MRLASVMSMICSPWRGREGECPPRRTPVAERDNRRCLAWILTLSILFTAHILGDNPAGRSAGSRETLIRISSEREGTSTHLFVENVQAADVTVTFEMELTNLIANVDFPYTTTLAGKTKVKLFTLSPEDASRGWSWTYTYYSTFGSTTAVHDDSYVYSLPYAPGKAFRVSQGYHGTYSHFGPDQYAIDWRMPLGTPVYAARGGKIVGVKNDSSSGGDDSKYDWDANYVLIQHSDGTLGQYVHLMKGGTCVQVGQQIEAGQQIGLSGNTGHSTGPHLHLSIFKAQDGKHRITIPVRFSTAEAFAITLDEGRSYRAVDSSTLLAGTKARNSGLPLAAPVGEPDSASLQAGTPAVGH